MKQGIDVSYEDLPDINKEELISIDAKFLEGKKFGEYIAFLHIDRFNDVHVNLAVIGTSIFDNQDKIIPTKYNISDVKAAIRALSVDYVLKYRRVIFASASKDKLKLYYRYAKYFEKKYKHAYKSKIKKHPHYGVYYFVATCF